MTYLEVAVAAPVSALLTYEVPDHLAAAGLKPGMRLLVPLGRRQVTGYLLARTDERPGVGNLKPIIDLLDPAPLFPAAMIPFYRWIARYYQHPIGEVIRSALPGGLTTESGRRVRLTAPGRRALADGPEGQPAWLDSLLAKGELAAGTCRRLWRSAADRRRLTQWAHQGWIEIEPVLRPDAIGGKSEVCIRRQPDALEQTGPLKPSEAKTLELLDALAAETGRPWVARRELGRRYPTARQAVKSLAVRGVVELFERPVYRDPFGELPPHFPAPAALTDEQQAALSELLPAVTACRFAPFLLHGVTGSGKTEVYLRAAAAALDQGRGVIVLVPEIALATQLEGHFLSRFGSRVALLHSGLSAGERYDQWQRLVSGEARVVIGARSAIFAPLADPGLIIVDEEHDPAYKQEDGLRYQARDLAVLRASQAGAAVILGTATPSLTSYHHALSGKYRLLKLERRVEDRPLPTVEIVDLRAVPTVSGRPPLFTNQLVTALRDTLARDEQSLLFLNRRGFAQMVMCQDCGQPVECRHCKISLTLHKTRRLLVCHYCGYTLTSATLCSHCRSTRLTGVGFGTERLEAELARLFPRAVVARLDRDTASNRRQYLAILKAVHQGEVDILVGTQMITKGHHFPGVTLVGIVWADAGLSLPDYKASERTFQLLAQVTGRAGRGERPGRVIVQTHQPDHYAIRTAQAHSYGELFERELALRRELGYPPFARLINLCLDSTEEAAVRGAAEHLAQRARSEAGRFPSVTVLGPAPAPLARLRGRYRWQLLLKGPAIEPLHALASLLAQAHGESGGTAGIKLAVDVDPESML